MGEMGREKTIWHYQLASAEHPRRYWYTDEVKRILQFGTLLLLLATFLTPLFEFFDRWDPPGPSNDTEMAVFGFIFALCLVLIVCKLTAVLATLISLILVSHLRQNRGSPIQQARVLLSFIVPDTSPPLRI
jgi:membrane protease YdiL (CAAX protease family)